MLRLLPLLALAACGPEPRLSSLQEELFTPRCATGPCHSAETAAGELVLTPGRTHAMLVGRAARTEEARAEGRLLVVPGDPAQSFLLEKLDPALAPSFGVPMPWGEPALEQELRDVVAEWVRLGALDD